MGACILSYTFASICTSGGVFEQGVIANNIQPIWGVEINPRVADVYRLNYPDSQIVVADVCSVDWKDLPRPDFLHASPSCRSFSGLNNKSEAEGDIAVADAVAGAIAYFKPNIFTLENVPRYQDSESWTIIFNQLKYLGYSVTAQVHKLKFWGVPQKRRNRFIAIATYHQPAIQLLTPNRTKYWYEEIEDLIPDLEPSELTQTQIDKLTPKTKVAIANKETVLLKRNQIRSYTPAAYSSEAYCWSPTATLCTDQKENKRSKFADLVTPSGIFELNVRCLARIQTIPDSYILPQDIAIAGLVVGDAIPPLFATQMWEQILVALNIVRTAAKPLTLIKENNYGDHDLLDLADDEIFQKRLSTIVESDTNNTGNSHVKESELEKLEFIVDSESSNMTSFEKIGNALLKIQNDRLFVQKGYASFIIYCQDRFSISTARIYQLINGAKTLNSVSTIVESRSLHLTESHCRELARVKNPEMRSQILNTLVESGGKITAAAIKQQSYQITKSASTARSFMPLPECGTVVRVLTIKNADLKEFHSYWGIVIEQHNLTVKVDTAIGVADGVAIDELMVIDQFDEAEQLLDKLKLILKLKGFPEIKPFAYAIASSPHPKPSEKCLELLNSLTLNVNQN